MAAFRRLRCSGYVTITSWGVTYGDRLVRWEQFRSANRRKSGVYLRLKEPVEDPAFVEFSATACAVSDERLTEVLTFYLANPHRRSALDTGPERLALPARPEPPSVPPRATRSD